MKSYKEISVKWLPPSDLGGGDITKYNIVVDLTSKETGKAEGPKELSLLPEEVIGRTYTLDISSYSNFSVRVREGAGEKPIWGEFSDPVLQEMGEGGKTIIRFLLYVLILLACLIE